MQIAAKSGVMTNLDGGKAYGGAPAVPVRCEELCIYVYVCTCMYIRAMCVRACLYKYMYTCILNIYVSMEIRACKHTFCVVNA